MFKDFGLEADIAADVLLRIVEDMLEVPVVDETVGGVLEELSDITFSMQEDCLNLAVSTPRLPTTESKVECPTEHFTIVNP